MLCKDMDKIMEYGFVDSIVTKIEWLDDFHDIAVYLDYYYGKNQPSKDLKLSFLNCHMLKFVVSDVSLLTSTEKWSHMTITNMQRNHDAKNKIEEVKIFTVDVDTPWLTVVFDFGTLEIVDSESVENQK